MKKSLKINAVANLISTIISIIFPLVTFPYIAKVLGVEKYGIYQFSNSIVSYFSYLAILGIPTYAIRTGSGLKNNNEKFNKFVNEIFSINIISTILAYYLLFTFIIFIRKFDFYRISILILSFSIIFTTLGVNWIFSINEDYIYTSIRTICIQIISIILIFLLVKNQNDLLKYIIISTFALSGGNIINIFYSRKYCKLKFTFKFNLKEHIIPLLILFVNNISIIIYVNLDITLLGIIKSDIEVGLYSVSAKIYFTIKQIINAIIVVTIPRLSMFFYQKKMIEFKNLLKKVYAFLIAILLPSCTGLFMLSKEIILIISGKEYLATVPALKILSISLLFCGTASYYSTAILIPIKNEGKVLTSTIVAAVLNIISNLILIPNYGIIGAAITTMAAELLVATLLFWYCRELKPQIDYKMLLVSIIESILIVLIVTAMKTLKISPAMIIIYAISLSVIIYTIINLALNTNIGIEIKKIIRKYNIIKLYNCCRLHHNRNR